MIMCGDKTVNKGEIEGSVSGSPPKQTSGEGWKWWSVTIKHRYVTIGNDAQVQRGTCQRLEHHHLIIRTHLTDRWLETQQLQLHFSIDSNTLASNFDVLNHIFIFELMNIPYLHVQITSYIPCIYTPILQIPWTVFLMNIDFNISTAVILNLQTHIYCLYSIKVDGMLNDLVISRYKISSLCVISQLDSDAIYVHYTKSHTGRQYHTTNSDGIIDCP